MTKIIYNKDMAGITMVLSFINIIDVAHLSDKLNKLTDHNICTITFKQPMQRAQQQPVYYIINKIYKGVLKDIK